MSDSSSRSGDTSGLQRQAAAAFSPLYQQIKALLVQSLERGEWKTYPDQCRVARIRPPLAAAIVLLVHRAVGIQQQHMHCPATIATVRPVPSTFRVGDPAPPPGPAAPRPAIPFRCLAVRPPVARRCPARPHPSAPDRPRRCASTQCCACPWLQS